MLHDIRVIQTISQNYNLADQKEVDRAYRMLKGRPKHGFFTWIGTSFYEGLKAKTTYAKYKRYASIGLYQIGILAFLMAFVLLGIGAAYKIKDHENQVLQEVLWEVKAENGPVGERVQVQSF